jgi:hypothetical protein
VWRRGNSKFMTNVQSIPKSDVMILVRQFRIHCITEHTKRWRSLALGQFGEWPDTYCTTASKIKYLRDFFSFMTLISAWMLVSNVGNSLWPMLSFWREQKAIWQEVRIARWARSNRNGEEQRGVELFQFITENSVHAEWSLDDLAEQSLIDVVNHDLLSGPYVWIPGCWQVLPPTVCLNLLFM